MAQFLLDTNTCIAAMKRLPKVVQRMAAISPADCFISSVTAFELYTGVEKCSNPTRERTKVNLLLNAMRENPFEPAAAKQAARIRALLESQGQPIGPYEVLLAGQAMATSLTLVTSNTREFSRVPGLPLEDWQK